MTEPTDDSSVSPENETGMKLETVTDHDVSRRKILLTGGVGAAAGLSGCSGLGDGGQQSPTPRVIERTRTVVKERTVEITPEPQPEDYVVTSHVFATGDVEDFEHSHFAASCAPQYQFVPGQTIGFRIGIWDAETGAQLTNDDLDAVTITVEGPTNVELEAGWDGDNEEHPADQWSVSWRDTDNAPAGQYKWTVNVTDSDSEAEFRHVGIWTNTFTLLEPGSVPTKTPTPTPTG